MAGALTAAIASIFSGSAVTADPYFEYTTLLLPGSGTNGAQNNTFLDGSTNNFTITRNGNTTQGTFSPFSQTGWGNYFDGTGDSLSVASNAAFAFGTSDFSVEFWINPSIASPANYTKYICTGAASGNFVLDQQTTANQITVNDNTVVILTSSSYTLTPFSWNHVVVTRGSGTLRIFINGVLTNSVANSTSFTQAGAFLGSGPTNTQNITGYLSNVRIVKGSVPTAYQTSSTTAGATIFTPPTTNLTTSSEGTTAANVSLLTCQSNRFIDNSTNNFTITRNGDTRVVAFSPFNPTASWSAATYGGSGYFDGSGDYLTTPDNAAYTVGSGNWTLEAWVYPTASPNQPIIVGQWSGGSDGSICMILSNDGNRYLRGLVYSGGTVDRISGSSLQLNAWNHCAFVREGTFLNLYLNGSRVDNYSFGSGSIQDSSLVMSIGAGSGGIVPFQGYICDCRFLKGTAQYTGATYTVPTAPLTAITNTSLLLNCTNAGIYDAASKNDLETVGDAQISNTTAKWGSTSIKFDGTGDCLIVPNSSIVSIQGDFTLESWVYLAAAISSGGYGTICSKYSAGALGTDDAWQWYIQNNAGTMQIVFGPVSGSSETTMTFTVTGASTTLNGVWNHIAVTRSGNSIRCFFNGTQIGTTQTYSSTINVGTNAVTVAARTPSAPDLFLNGYIQDLRITTGYARYTSNFTAPTAAFPAL